MIRTKLAAIGLLSLTLAPLSFGKTHKIPYQAPCSQLWQAVTSTLSNQENYNLVRKDDTQMTAAYHVKHTVHVTVTGAVLQRTNHVTLVPNGSGCEMQVVSNYSGFEHNDQDDFKKRVDQFLANPSAPPPADAAKPETPAK
ncbi:MAG: hypothetical protein ABSB23_08460 [Bryobacteraceae bacterium]|jgi:glycerol-3-phosphate dehydrogenase